MGLELPQQVSIGFAGKERKNNMNYPYFEIYSLFVGYGLYFVDSLENPQYGLDMGERLTAEEVGQWLGGNWK